MIVNGVFKIKGRGWVITGVPDVPTLHIRHILTEDGVVIGVIKGTEHSTSNPTVGFVLSSTNVDELPKINDRVYLK